MADRDPEVQRLLDERAIIAVAIDYTWALDERRFDDLRAVFTPEATARLGNPARLEGIDAIIARVEGALSPLDDSQHLVGNHQVHVVGDGSATHRCYLHAQHIRRGVAGGEQYIVAGRYVDRFAHTSAGWRISHRTLDVMWTHGNRAVIHPT